MDFVPTTTKQLATLAEHDTHLRPYFAGVLASDRLPASPIKSRPQGYIVNVDRHDSQGSHWLGVWTDDDTCEVMDSFGTTSPGSRSGRETISGRYEKVARPCKPQ